MTKCIQSGNFTRRIRIKAGLAVSLLACVVLVGSCGTMDDMMPNGEDNSTFRRVNNDAVYTDGNVGIGTETPTQRLDVEGNAKVSGNVTVGGTVFANAFSSNSPLHLQTAGETRIFVDDNNGNVGIGTVNPERSLHVAGNALFNTFVILDSTGVQPPEFSGRRSRSANAPVETGDALTIYSGRGWNGSAFPSGGFIQIVASQAWSSSANGGRMQFHTTPTNSTSSAERMRIDGNGNVGIGTTNPTEKLHVVGNICATGTIAACSDSRFKTNVTPLDRALDKIEKLRPVAYDWKRDEYPDRDFSDRRQIGLIAQELREILPEAVQEGSDGYLAVDYSRLTPVLVEAVRELRTEKGDEIERLRKEKDAKIAELEQRLGRLEAALSERHSQESSSSPGK